MRSKPSSCNGCVLYNKGTSFALPIGPKDSKILLVGEALGTMEAIKGEPFVGPAGSMLNSILKRSGLEREQVRIANVVSCQPPKDWLDGAPWEWDAIAHCRQHLDPVLDEGHEVVVALGASATRTLLGLPKKGFKLEHWHGSPVRDPNDRFWVVPTFHPAFILRGNQKYLGVSYYDMSKAKEISEKGFERDVPYLRVDPPIEWFSQWVENHLANSAAWLAVDIETPYKLLASEDELEDRNDAIIRINFSNSPEEGITVPWEGRYLPLVGKLLTSLGVKCLWNARFDTEGLARQGYPIAGTVLDFMWGWHSLQTSLPASLGFVAPFYSSYGPWKHMCSINPGTYAALDAVQTIRCAFGIAKDLKQQGLWDVFYRHVYELDTKVLHPAEEVGLLVDTEALDNFGKELEIEKAKVAEKIQALVPSEIQPLYPKEGWKNPPESYEEEGLTYVPFPVDEKLLVQCCSACGAVEIAKSHRCKDKTLTPKIILEEKVVKRFYVKLPFNPNSVDQLIQYMELKGVAPSKGKKKKTTKPSTDNKVLEKLAKKDPFYKLILDYRAYGKVLGTYVEGTRSRLGNDGRLHPSFLHRPSTWRLSCVNPNLQNVVDKE
jgi:DNA polymerase